MHRERTCWIFPWCCFCLAAFSLLFDGSRQPARVLLLDRDKRTYLDLQKEKKAAKRDRASEVGPKFDSFAFSEIAV